jgi:hypothetical protein
MTTPPKPTPLDIALAHQHLSARQYCDAVAELAALRRATEERDILLEVLHKSFVDNNPGEPEPNWVVVGQSYRDIAAGKSLSIEDEIAAIVADVPKTEWDRLPEADA